jgi:hypothetical protein
MKINPEGAIQYEILFKTEKPRTIVMKPDAVAVLEEWRRASGRNYGDDTPVFPDRFGGHYSTIEPVVKLFRRLRKETGLVNMTPGSVRNTAITRDIMDGYTEAYVCFRCWGVASSPMVNVYVRKARAAQMQSEQQRKINGNGQPVKMEPEKPRKIANLKPCPACGKENAVSGSFCAFCGANMSGEAKGLFAKLQGDNKALLTKVQEQTDRMQSMEEMIKAMEYHQSRLAAVVDKLRKEEAPAEQDEPLPED